MAVIQSLAEVPLFSGLGSQDLAVISERVRQRRYREGDTIFRRDDPGVALYIIVSGKVKIHNQLPDGSDVMITVYSAGDFFGEMAVIDGDERSADATTIEASELLMLTKEDMHDIIQRHPRIGLNLLITLAGRLRRSTDALRAMSALDVNGRVAKQLLTLAEQHGTKTDDGTRIQIRLTQSDIAALVGSSRESVNKVLGYYRKRGCVDWDDRHYITIRDPAELKRRCEDA